MTDGMLELNVTEACPCGSGLDYGMCCKPKGIKWERGEGRVCKSKNITMPEEVADAFERSRERFFCLFGRYPADDDRLMYDFPIHSNEYFYETMAALRALGMPEDYIYAFYRTDGLLPNEMNIDNISQGDINEFNYYQDEYRELLFAEPKELRCNVMQYVMVANEAIELFVEEAVSSLSAGMNYYINCQSGEIARISCVPATMQEYAVFVALKSLKTFQALHKLMDIRETGSIYALGRGLFESYIYLKAINANDDFFDEYLKPVMLSNEYGFETDAFGTINYRKLSLPVKKPRHRKEKTLQQLESKYGTAEDHGLYELFYKAACQFVHVDALTARSYFYEGDLYEELAPHGLACLCSLSCGIMVAQQLAQLDAIDGMRRSDMVYLAKALAEESAKCFEVVLSDPEQAEEEHRIFLNRMRRVSRRVNSISFT